MTVGQARAAGDCERQIEALGACLAHPCAAHEFDLAELFSELGGCYRSAGRYGEAIDAWEQAIAVGYRSVPHPRAEIAELLLAAGRRGEADALFAQLRDQCRDDVWLYNSAGLSYAECGDHAEAVHWLYDGINLALETGDPEQVLGQLMEFRHASLKALDRDPDDELGQRVAAFERPSGPRRALRRQRTRDRGVLPLRLATKRPSGARAPWHWSHDYRT
jgi:tetratricopeptide (TPR) repeat protein